MANDVFVIGAGASVPYGFPTGDALLKKIRKLSIGNSLARMLSNSTHIALDEHVMQQIYWGMYPLKRRTHFKSNPHIKTDFYKKVHLEVCQYLENSCILSIDQFLKNHFENDLIQTYGKCAIANQILKAENESFKNRNNEDVNFSLGNIDWIQHLLTKIDVEYKEDEALKTYLRETTFITFNYDRVLEWYFQQYLVFDRKFSEDEANSFIEDMRIYHINGSLGSLEEIPFGDVNSDKYTDIITNMRTVWEEPDSEHSYRAQKAQESVQKAERIFILGTSYIPDNNRAIGLNDIGSSKTLRGTGYKLSEANISRANKHLGLKDEYKCIKDKTAVDLIIDEY